MNLLSNGPGEKWHIYGEEQNDEAYKAMIKKKMSDGYWKFFELFLIISFKSEIFKNKIRSE